MFLRRLKIDALPGIEPGFTFQPPGEGVNIVIGPNAVGKSSLARALGYLLRDARTDDPPGLLLSAELQGENTRWRVSRIGGEILWFRDGESTSRPSLPSGEQIGLYRLSLENLLASDKADLKLARELRRQLRGGFDLQAPRIPLGARFARNEERTLRDAMASLKKVETDYSTLHREEAQLSGLSDQIERAKAATEEVERLQSAISLQESVVQLNHYEARLREFPDAIAALNGDELDRLDGLENKKRHDTDDLERQRAKLDARRRTLQATGLDRAGPTADAMVTVEKLLRQLAEQLVAWENARQEVVSADARHRDAMRELGAMDKPPKLDRDGLGQVQQLVAPLLNARARREELESQLKFAEVPPEQHEIERLQLGADALRDWLALRRRIELDANRRDARTVRIVTWIGFTASAVAAVAAGIAAVKGFGAAEVVGLAAGIDPTDAVSGLEGIGPAKEPYTDEGTGLAHRFDYVLLALIGAVVTAGSTLAALVTGKRLSARELATVQLAQDRYSETGLEQPPEWTLDAVREHLRSHIDRKLYDLFLQRERAGKRESLNADLESTRSKLRELEAKRDTLAEELGFDADLPMLAYERFANLCIRLDEARGVWESQQAQCAHLTESIDDLTASAAAFLAEWGQNAWPPPQAKTDDDANSQPRIGNDRKSLSTGLQSAFDELRNRVDSAKAEIVAIENEEAEIVALKRRIAEADQEIEAIYGRAGLPPGDRAALAGLVERLDGWREANKGRERARGREQPIREDLRNHPDLAELADAGANDELETRLQDAQRKAAELTGLVERRSSIATRLSDAGREGALEKAIAAEAQARETLADKRDEAYLNCATELLLDEVETEFQSKREPDVLRRAKELFDTATGQEFALQLRPDDTFVAHDNKQGVLRDVDRLSSGTRMQLLIALRLAWTEAQEQGGEPLPLFLDEALTTSDEGRFKVIAESLERLADGQNRQIFYLAARQHEAALWREATGKQPPVVNLAEVRFAQSSQSPEAFRIEMPPALSAPGNRTAEEYAALLRVPPIDPRRPVESLHLFHLLRDDLNLLHHLIDRWRILSLGQLEGLLASNAHANALPDEGIRNRLAQRCGAFRVWVELWRQGRGKPVDRRALEQSGAVSRTFINATAELVDELNGDGRALVNALRDGKLKGFRSGKTDDLEAWLIEQQFLDERSIPPAEDRARLTVRELAPATNAALDDINAAVRWFEAGVGQ